MLITPDKGKMVFGLLMILAGLGMTAGSVIDFFRAKSRTSVAEVRVLKSFPAMMGIGPLRHYSTNVKYEFVVDGLRIEREQLVDNLPDGPVYVRFDPTKPNNNRLAHSDTSSRFLGLIAGLLMIVGVGLVLRVWSPIVRPRSTTKPASRGT